MYIIFIHYSYVSFGYTRPPAVSVSGSDGLGRENVKQ